MPLVHGRARTPGPDRPAGGSGTARRALVFQRHDAGPSGRWFPRHPEPRVRHHGAETRRSGSHAERSPPEEHSSVHPDGHRDGQEPGARVDQRADQPHHGIRPRGTQGKERPGSLPQRRGIRPRRPAQVRRNPAPGHRQHRDGLAPQGRQGREHLPELNSHRFRKPVGGRRLHGAGHHGKDDRPGRVVEERGEIPGPLRERRDGDLPEHSRGPLSSRQPGNGKDVRLRLPRGDGGLHHGHRFPALRGPRGQGTLHPGHRGTGLRQEFRAPCVPQGRKHFLGIRQRTGDP